MLMNYKSKTTDVKILQILLLFISLLYGGFYEFVGYVAGIILCIILWIQVLRKNRIQFYCNLSVIAILTLCLGYGMTVFYGIDKGMAFLGFLKYLSVVIFLLVLMQVSPEEKIQVFDAIPCSAILILVFSIFSALFRVGTEFFYLSGRLGGSFQYSNTMALYFLCGSVILRYRCNDIIKYRILSLALYVGILLTGSRTVFFMTVAWLLYDAILNKVHRWFYIFLIVASVLTGIFYVSLTGDFQNIGRFLTASLSSSTMLGRLLYWQDGLQIVKEHPLGIGYRGYEYIQGLYRTGNYEVMFIHNDWLQFVIDIGIISTVIFVIGVGSNIISKSNGKMERTILFILCIHSVFDFDLQFSVMALLMILCMEIHKGKSRNFLLKKRKICCAVGCAAICIILGYFSLVTLLHYRGESRNAVKMYPYYTEANETILESSDDFGEAKIVSDKVIMQNEYCGIAHNVQALVRLEEGDYLGAAESQERAIRLNPYNINEYKMYLQILSEGISLYRTKEDMDYEKLLERVCSVSILIQDAEKKVSYLGKRIRDPVNLKLPEDMELYIETVEKLVRVIGE